MTEIQTIGVVGAGAMGRGIAQIAAQAGLRVRLYDTSADAVAAARESLRQTWDKLAQKGKLTAADAQAALERVESATALTDMSQCQLVVEAIVERLDVKRDLFAALEGVVADDCILASNTSSLSITAIAAACKLPQRVAGYHFFNPVALMKVVEVIDGLRSARDRRRAGRTGAPHGPHAGARQGHARLHRQPRRSRHEHRRPARGAGIGGELRAGGCHHARAGRLPHGPVRAAGPDRAGRFASGDGIHLPPVLRRAALSPVAHHHRAPGRRPDRPQGRRGFTSTSTARSKCPPSRPCRRCRKA